jgi:hypothetical protein
MCRKFLAEKEIHKNRSQEEDGGHVLRHREVGEVRGGKVFKSGVNVKKYYFSGRATFL